MFDIEDIKRVREVTLNLSVLYVEDDKSVREQVANLINSFFNDISIATDGLEGLNKYKEKEFDIVITDILMPKMSGLEMAQEIKKINKNQNIIITSAYNEPKYFVEAIEIGVDGFVLKPIQIKQFLNVLVKSAKFLIDARDKEYYKKDLEAKVRDEMKKNLEKTKMIEHQSRFAEMGEMIGAIAHQWKQPLNTLASIMVDLEIRSEFEELSKDEIKDSIKNANRQIQFMAHTIDDFRNFFKPSKEKIKFFVKEAIDDILKLLMPQFKTNTISISINSNENMCEVEGYLNEFKQVILNIANNAKDAIVEKRQKDRNFAMGKIEISLIPNDKFITISISDNAGGIKCEILDKIFEPYISTKGDKGTGIGLYLAKSIIENSFGGKIYAKNLENGAEFSIELPIFNQISKL